jgi:hypothetical protein
VDAFELLLEIAEHRDVHLAEQLGGCEQAHEIGGARRVVGSVMTVP